MSDQEKNSKVEDLKQMAMLQLLIYELVATSTDEQVEDLLNGNARLRLEKVAKKERKA